MSLDSASGFGAERIAGIYAQAPTASAVNFLLAAIAVAVMWSRVPDALLLGWLALVVLSHLLRLGLWRQRRQDPSRDAHWLRWAHRCVVAMLATGLIWGGGAVVLFDPAEPLLVAFWLIIVCGIGAGVVAASAFYLPALWAYLFPLLLPIIMRIAMEDAPGYRAIALGMVLFLVFCVQQGRHQGQLILESLRMRSENRALVASLSIEKHIAEAARQVAEDSSAAKARFFAAASHDLRQPLQAIALFSGGLKHASLPPEEARLVGKIDEGVNALSELFDDLLEISRLDARAVVPQARWVPLQAVFERLELLFAPIATDNGTRLYFRPCAHSLFVDELLLSRVLGNFVGNAVKYAQGGTVAVLARRQGGQIRIEVRDNGPGIDEADQALVFEEFYQADNPDRDRKRGFGLGLATAKRIALLLDAAIGLRSTPGRGSVFWVRLDAATLG
ncbi:MAG: HAMP domain-containing sensor histidine kinase [Sulfuritalea sp.]|nr:HAMP domain-containing sensor histidine kinase [Sulfuritalea sp.]MDP1981418.1 HAMP domain-containing sensor histidine kinase [Sulfuritalea sp.]